MAAGRIRCVECKLIVPLFDPKWIIASGLIFALSDHDKEDGVGGAVVGKLVDLLKAVFAAAA
eukprot:CAMPEP_0171847894 /NCGR_PEP_ID=MMETSP0992-20121227/18667_1 /TAXON_ID=483369 /ORGANISM="non described non described, Strain CCMP2098" /LENGTH=61 /DNA_ID=CAMNT_0012466629 /DNA_START=332 /DNA_END=514 /DNA_ORIENTATION=-